jgi:aspartate carbamoyltransferase regulatory subunit
MIFKRQTNVSSATYALNFSHDKIVDMLNDEDVKIEDGNVSANQIFTLSLIEPNGTRQYLYDLKPSQKLSIRFKSTTKSEADCSWLKIKTTAIKDYKMIGGVVVGGNKTIIKCIYNPRSSGGVIIGGSFVDNLTMTGGVVVGGTAPISGEDLFYEIQYSQTGLCCHEPIFQIYNNYQRLAAGANYFTLKPIVEDTFVESTLVPPEFQKFGLLPRAAGKGLFHNYLAPGLPFNIGYNAAEQPRLRVPYPKIEILEGESIESNDWRVFMKMSITGVNYKTPVIYKLFPSTGEREINITSDIFIPQWWGSPGIDFQWPVLPSGTLAFLAREEEEQEYSEDGTRSNGIGTVSSHIVLSGDGVLPPSLTGYSPRVCSINSIFHLPDLVRMTEYDCMEVMEGARFVSDQELESGPLDENHQCDYCKDACCYPLYDCSTCLQNNPDSGIIGGVDLSGAYGGFNPQHPDWTRLEYFSFTFNFTNVAAASPIDLNKAAWNWRNDYPNKLAGKRVVWWLVEGVKRLEHGIPPYQYQDHFSHWAWIKYKKYFCLVCEDGELVDITDEAIEGLPVYIEEDTGKSGWTAAWNIIDTNFIYTQNPSGGINCGGRSALVYSEKMKGGVVVGVTSLDRGVCVGGSAEVDVPLGFFFGEFNDIIVENNNELDETIDVVDNKNYLDIDEQITTSLPFINQISLQSVGTIKFTEIGSTVNYSFVYFEKYTTDWSDDASQCDNTATYELTRVFLTGNSQKDLNDLIAQYADNNTRTLSFYQENLVNQIQNNYGFHPQEIPMIDEFRRYDQPPTSLDCTDQEPIGYLCKDKLTRTLEKWEPASDALERRDRRSWCEHTKKGTFYETTICEEVTCPAEELGMTSADKPQNTTIRPERRKNPLP